MEVEQVIEILSFSPIYKRLTKDEKIKAIIYFCMAYENVRYN